MLQREAGRSFYLGDLGLLVILTGGSKTGGECHHTTPLTIKQLVVAAVEGVDAIVSLFHLLRLTNLRHQELAIHLAGSLYGKLHQLIPGC